MTRHRSTASRSFVVFAGPDIADSTVEAIEALVRAMPAARFLVVQAGNPIRGRRWWRSKWRRLRREPISYPCELACGLLRRSRRRRAARSIRLPAYGQGVFENVELARFDRLHGADCLDRVRAFEPWLGISCGAPILRRKLFAIPELGTVNVHKSMLPEYRGMPSGFWELADGATATGVSVHWVDDGLDTGDIVWQEALPIDPYATRAGLLAKLDELAAEVLVEAVRRIDGGAACASPQRPPETPARRRPPFLFAWREKRRLEARRRGTSRLREAVKRLVFTGYVMLWAPLRNALRARRGCPTAILLYHRVSDAFLDPVTVGVEQFARHLEVLARHYDVLDMPAFLAELGTKRRRPAVVLTFDDGYEDNWLAARLLRRAGLPCTFFVCTGIVGTEKPFAHDMKKVGRRVPALTWDRVETMHEQGFHISNHTVTHINAGRVAHDEAITEIREARAHLVTHLGETGAERWFAYCFGRRSDMTEHVRSALPGLGIDFCFSAYGGVNPPAQDPFDLRRVAVGHKISDIGLRALIEGWPTRMKAESAAER